MYRRKIWIAWVMIMKILCGIKIMTAVVEAGGPDIQKHLFYMSDILVWEDILHFCFSYKNKKNDCLRYKPIK